MMLANDLKTYYDEVRRYLDCPKDEQDRLLLSVNKQVNGITAGVTGTEYSKSLASGWSYTNHKITTTNVSSSSGGTATLTATLKDFPINVPVRLSLHCAPNGAITRG